VALSNAAKNAMLDAVLQGSITISLHTADPGATGANELTGGGYARQSATFSLASGGSASNSGTVTWTNLPACTITHMGIWKSGTFQCGVSATAARTIQAGDGTFINPGALQLTVV